VTGATARNASLEAEAAATNEYYAWLSFLTASVAALFSIVGLFLISNKVVRPLVDMTGAMTDLAAGNIQPPRTHQELQVQTG
jgi:nitrogen fixation/metabolism regulation signal transduction histidine kinase